MKKWQKKAIGDIMKSFDFKKVHKTMKRLDWEWLDETTGDFGVPTEQEIKNSALKMLKVLVKESFPWIDGGGFRASQSEAEKSISLEFILETRKVLKRY